VPKKGGVVNIGVGGNAETLQQRGSTIQEQWEYLVAKIRRMGLVEKDSLNPRGYVYHLRGNDLELVADNLYIIGDAAGLATLDMGEGIGPAIQSGLLAADAILGFSPFKYDPVPKYSLLPPWLRWLARG
jgi:flavin-dependent dehydrogenase